MISKCVWVVDDDPIFRLIFSMTLKKAFEDYTLIEHENGQLAFESLSQDVEENEKLPECLFIDVNMPEMTGWECLDKLMELCPSIRNRLPKIYIISSSINLDDVQKAYSYPITSGYLTKPISVTRLKEILSIEDL